ncbi:MAG: hypothetical protein ACYCXR_04265 [Coriobacteriia bacterium]
MSTTLKRIGIGAGVAVLVVAALVVAMFAFGKPTTPQAPPQTAASVEVVTPQADEPPVVPGQESASAAPDVEAAPEQGSDPLAVEIPGCVCHSDDPVVVEAHASYRMSDCFDCHSGGMPEMGQ